MAWLTFMVHFLQNLRKATFRNPPHSHTTNDRTSMDVTDPTLYAWVLATTFGVSMLAWVGIVVLFLRDRVLERLMSLLVAFAAGTLVGGAMFHLLIEALEKKGVKLSVFVWFVAGFSVFLLLEQLLQMHHHVSPNHRHHKKPVTYMILFADGLHNFTGGLAIAGSFLLGVPTGLITVLSAAAHEIPQELGDFAILVNGGWKKKKALLLNFVSAIAIVPGGLVAILLAGRLDITFLLPFAAGNFVYVAAADLIPEIKHEPELKRSLLFFTAFSAGILLLLGVKLLGA